MKQDEAAAARKRTEIVEAVRRLLSERFAMTERASAEALVEHFTIITPPDQRLEPPPNQPAEVTPPTGTRPGTVEFNYRKIVAATAGGALTLPGVTAPWNVLLAAMIVWDSLWAAVHVEIGETEAFVLWVLWKARDNRDMVAKSRIVTAVNTELNIAARPLLTPAQIEAALTRLRRLKCIETARSALDSYWLRECAQVQYS